MGRPALNPARIPALADPWTTGNRWPASIASGPEPWGLSPRPRAVDASANVASAIPGSCKRRFGHPRFSRGDTSGLLGQRATRVSKSCSTRPGHPEPRRDLPDAGRQSSARTSPARTRTVGPCENPGRPGLARTRDGRNQQPSENLGRWLGSARMSDGCLMVILLALLLRARARGERTERLNPRPSSGILNYLANYSRLSGCSTR